MRELNKEDTAFVVTVLNQINEELNRCFFEKYGREMYSPFDNTGSKYSCDAFTVRAYNEQSNDVYNFVYSGGLKACWYKHLGRGDVVFVPDDWTMSDVREMLINCIICIRDDFEEIEHE